VVACPDAFWGPDEAISSLLADCFVALKAPLATTFETRDCFGAGSRYEREKRSLYSTISPPRNDI